MKLRHRLYYIKKRHKGKAKLVMYIIAIAAIALLPKILLQDLAWVIVLSTLYISR